MKLFVADKAEQGYVSPTDYHWCDDGDLLMFGQFQLDNNNPSQVSMCGINSRKFTTHIMVKDVIISKSFYRELLTESIESAMNCKVDENGDFDVNIAWGFHFNINDIMNELLEKASQFNAGDKLKCQGRTLTKIE
jgi:diaminopimelate epimerase